jgi:hypothetical protein
LDQDNQDSSNRSSQVEAQEVQQRQAQVETPARLLDYWQQLIPWLKEPAGETFFKWVGSQLALEIRHLEHKDESMEIYRSQGRIEVWRRLNRLLIELRQYEADIKAGKIRPKKPGE